MLQFFQFLLERDQEEIALLFQQYALVDLAVTDKADRIIGVIIFDDIVDVIKEEAEEDFFWVRRS